MKESFLKVGNLFLSLTFPVLVTLTRFLACTFTKVWSTSALKRFCRHSYIFGILTHLLMDKPLLALKHTSKHNSWGLNSTKYWRLFIVEYLQPNKLKKSYFNPIYYVSWFLGWRAYMKTPAKISMKVQRIAAALSGMLS